MSLNKENQKQLLLIARHSIEVGCRTGAANKVELANLPEALSELRATFVTLTKQHQLRGCIGVLTAFRPIAEDVAENAFAAAFKDSRFPPVTASELKDLHIHISVLSKPEPILFSSEQDLLRQLRPGIDGLIIKAGSYRATFLPSVWESLNSPKQFLNHLKQKAGLPADYWSQDMQVDRYVTESISESDMADRQ